MIFIVVLTVISTLFCSFLLFINIFIINARKHLQNLAFTKITKRGELYYRLALSRDEKLDIALLLFVAFRLEGDSKAAVYKDFLNKTLPKRATTLSLELRAELLDSLLRADRSSYLETYNYLKENTYELPKSLQEEKKIALAIFDLVERRYNIVNIDDVKELIETTIDTKSPLKKEYYYLFYNLLKRFEKLGEYPLSVHGFKELLISGV